MLGSPLQNQPVWVIWDRIEFLGCVLPRVSGELQQMVLTDKPSGDGRQPFPGRLMSWLDAVQARGQKRDVLCAVGRGPGSSDSALQELCFENVDLCSGCTWLGRL